MQAPSDLPVEDPAVIAPAVAAKSVEVGSFFSSGEMNLTLVICAFGLSALIVFFILVRSERADPFTLRIFVVIILVIGTLLVVSSSYATTQIAPIVGFFGTIAGYLLGKGDRNDNNS
jgi:hypothetical protein